MYFQIKKKANYYDCDCNNELKISAAMRYMQQASSEHLEALGYSADKLFAEHMVFLLSKMCIKVHKMPQAAQPIMIGTTPTMTRGARFVREFVIDSIEGERLVSGLSLWILADTQTHKVLRPSSFPYQLPFRESIVGNEISDIRFPKRLEGQTGMRTQIKIGYSHLDLNQHVNNSYYADFICDCLPFDQLVAQKIDTLAINFQNEAKWNAVLDIHTIELAEREYMLQGMDQGNTCFEAMVLLKNKQ